MKKSLLVLVLIFFLTGCGSSKYVDYSVNYNLDISKVFEEKINFAIPKNAYKIADENKDIPQSPYPLEYSLLYREFNPIFSNSKEVYNKKIKKYNDNIVVTLAYNYPEKYFVYSNLITVCFENYDLISGDDYFEVNLSGAFSCSNQIKKLNINISTDYDVLDSNGKKSDSGYSWSFDEDDFSDIDVHFKISRDFDKMLTVADNSFSDKRSKTIRNLRIAVFVVMIIVIVGFVIRFYFMKKDLE